MKTYKTTYAGVLLALGVILPIIFHTIGGTASGKTFLPMHIPVLLAGMLLGPVYGLVIGALAPVLSSFITGMPMMAILPAMVVELSIYGLVSGFVYHVCKFRKIKWGSVVTLIITMIVGRLLYALSLYIMINWLGITLDKVSPVIVASVAGVYGIIIQLVFIPIIVKLAQKYFVVRYK